MHLDTAKTIEAMKAHTKPKTTILTKSEKSDFSKIQNLPKLSKTPKKEQKSISEVIGDKVFEDDVQNP